MTILRRSVDFKSKIIFLILKFLKWPDEMTNRVQNTFYSVTLTNGSSTNYNSI